MSNKEHLPPEVGLELTPLQFTYVRTYDPNRAEYTEWRDTGISINGVRSKPRTDEEIFGLVKDQKEKKDWFITEEWRSKGKPLEQIEFRVNDAPITIYNWNRQIPFSDEHIKGAEKVFRELGSRFPQILNHLRWILIENHQEPSVLGDPVLYPTSGVVRDEWRTFILYPKGLELEPYRMPPIPNFIWALTHEVTHLIQEDFEKEWRGKFRWEY